MSNSKQLNFFVFPSDWPEIEKFFLDQKIICLNNVALTEDLEVPSIKDSGQIYLSSKNFLNQIFYNHYEKRKVVNILKSDVIEFGRGGFYENALNVLHRSRLYAVTQYFQDLEKVSKSEEFISWVTEVLAAFKKRFLQKTKMDREIIFSENAIDWINAQNATLHKSGLYISY